MDRRKIYTVYASQALRTMAYEMLVGAGCSVDSAAGDDSGSTLQAKLQAEQDCVDLQLQAYNFRESGNRKGAMATAMTYREDLRWAARALRELHRLPVQLIVQLVLLSSLAILYLVVPMDIFSEARSFFIDIPSGCILPALTDLFYHRFAAT